MEHIVSLVQNSTPLELTVLLPCIHLRNTSSRTSVPQITEKDRSMLTLQRRQHCSNGIGQIQDHFPAHVLSMRIWLLGNHL